MYLAGQLNFNAGEYAKAAERMAAYLAAEPNGSGATDAHYMLALSLQGSDEDRAITHYRSFLDGAPAGDARLADANYALGTIYYNRDDCGNAEQHYQTLLELAPDHAERGAGDRDPRPDRRGGLPGRLTDRARTPGPGAEPDPRPRSGRPLARHPVRAYATVRGTEPDPRSGRRPPSPPDGPDRPSAPRGPEAAGRCGGCRGLPPWP